MSLVVRDPVSRKDLFQKSQEERHKITQSPPSEGCFFPYNNWALKQDHITKQSNFGQDNCTSYCY